MENGFGYVRGLLFDYDDAIQAQADYQLKFGEYLDHESQRLELRDENKRLRTLMDFERDNPQFKLLPAQVIQHSQGTLTIDQGRRDGLKPSMCVITPDGVVGMVTQVEPFSASVVTLQNADCRIDTMVRRNRVRGRVLGTGNDLSSICTMHYVDLNANIREGDVIVTSPDSVFPSGYPVGRVVGTPYRGSLSQALDIFPAVDPFRLDEVFVLLSADSLVEPLPATGPVVLPFEGNLELMDTLSIQERFAP